MENGREIRGQGQTDRKHLSQGFASLVCEGLGRSQKVRTPFIKRMQEREDELKEQNFAVGPGLRVNMLNLTNPTQLRAKPMMPVSQRTQRLACSMVPLPC